MPLRGTTIKQATPEKLTLLRPMVTRRYELTVDHDTCCGCGTCATVCPREAITLSKAGLAEGRVVEPVRIDISTECSFCGECVALCPTHALAMTVNGQPEIPVIKGQAFPFLVRNMKVDQAILEVSTDAAYIDNCPVGAISAEVTRDASGKVTAVRNVEVDRKLCINCTRCMQLGPEGGFTVTKPYKGRVTLNALLCPAGCQACADVCPTKTITYDSQRVWLDERFCIYCGACQQVCPVEGAVRSARSGFVHTPIHSAAWARAVEKLVSYQEAVREAAVKDQQKRRKVIMETILSGKEPSC
jgi:4Fe-4S ferredoxin